MFIFYKYILSNRSIILNLTRIILKYSAYVIFQLLHTLQLFTQLINLTKLITIVNSGKIVIF